MSRSLQEQLAPLVDDKRTSVSIMNQDAVRALTILATGNVHSVWRVDDRGSVFIDLTSSTGRTHTLVLSDRGTWRIDTLVAL